MQQNENPFNDTRSQKINEDICFVYSFDFFIAFNSTDAWVKNRFSRHFAAKLIKLCSWAYDNSYVRCVSLTLTVNCYQISLSSCNDLKFRWKRNTMRTAQQHINPEIYRKNEKWIASYLRQLVSYYLSTFFKELYVRSTKRNRYISQWIVQSCLHVLATKMCDGNLSISI